MIKIAILVLLTGCAGWSEKDTQYEIAYQVVNAADAYTTARMRHIDGIEEKNTFTQALIGSQPKESDVALLFFTYGISHYMISAALPERWRRFYQVSTLSYSSYLVINNCRLGLC